MNYTLITGASQGIGLELARLYAEKAHNLILVARTEQKLRDIAVELRNLYGVTIHYFSCDLSKPSEVKRLIYFIRKKNYEIETLINNAGFGNYGEFHKSSLAVEQEMLQLNMVSLMTLTRAFLPGMLFRGQGGVLNVASAAAFVPGPRMANYYATKAYVLSLTESLAAELSSTSLKIAALCPGPVPTGFQERANMAKAGQMLRKFRPKWTAKQVAYYAYERYQAGDVIIIPGRSLKTALYLVRLLPKKYLRRLMALFQ